ncbi:MAG: site-specific integrase [Ktedonobacteraceae bacterium]|jgi:integrase|nr:site-specific integrase [Ktedonobacteraceae bacterium]
MLDRLDGLMALEQSRGKAKEVARVAHQKTWAFSTGKIHSYKTRMTYQEHAINFVKWARDAYGLKQLELIDERAGELTAEFLQARVDEGKSAYTLQVVRAALRMVFADRSLMKDVEIPRRTRSTITRSRGVKAHDKHFNPENWPKLINFLKATGLRRDELKLLRAQDILERDPDPTSRYFGQAVVQVWNGKGGKERTVPVLVGHEQEVFAVREGLADEDRVFLRIPKHLDVHSYRREYAQAVYLFHAPGRSLPPPSGRLKRKDYDREAAEQVTFALGHNRIDVVLRHYIR